MRVYRASRIVNGGRVRCWVAVRDRDHIERDAAGHPRERPAWRVSGYHVHNASVSHACSGGSYDDPGDTFDTIIVAVNKEVTEEAALRILSRAANHWKECKCSMGLIAGSPCWFKSLQFGVVPVNIPAKLIFQAMQPREVPRGKA